MINPSISVPGRIKRTNDMAKLTQNKWVEYPKMVYTPGLEKHTIIHCAEECPDGYYEHAEAVQKGQSVAEEAVQVGEDAAAARLEAEQAQREAKKAEKEYRQEIMAYLDGHNVDYAKNLSTPKLEALKTELDEFLGQQDQTDDGTD
jgi:hypothetical protein